MRQGNYDAGDVFRAFLYEKSRLSTEFEYDMIRMHRAFYDASKQFPTEMKRYDFLITTNPYSPTLEKMLTLSQLSGLIILQPNNKITIVADELRRPARDMQRIGRHLSDML
jgi:hypothetical protein